MNNEPVGWIGYQEDRLVSFLQNFQQVNQFLDATNPTGKVIPLYTHPVKEQDTDCKYCKQGCIRCDARKQLTDEEIANTWDDVRKDATFKSSMKDIQDFARAILRKAQEN